ncbi:MAG: hypothetical protein EPO24_10880 [Bacteroidetes bacterium]|nr:MAG: hypothetical protein EPO24_10880 [Bacteroidota bacterium]
MLKNHIKDTDLKKFYPNLANQLWGSQQNYQTQIDKAFDMLLNELHNRNIDSRLCMIPLDLKRPETATTHEPLTSVTETEATTGEAFMLNWQRRFVVNALSIAGTNWVIKLQGSNKIEKPASDDTSWKDISGASITLTTIGEQSVQFVESYRWVRCVSTPSGANPSLTYTVFCVDTMWDDVICYGTFVLLFTDFMLEINDVWDIRRQQALSAYTGALDSIRFPFDTDDDGIIDATGNEEQHATLRLVR